MKLMQRVWLVAFLVLAVAMGAVSVLSLHMADTRVQEEVLKTARTLRDLLMTVRYTYHQRFLASGLPLDERTLGFLPAHAMTSISTDFKRFHDLGISFRNVSDRARNPANQADATEMEAIRWFQANPQAKERLIKISEGRSPSFYFYATPIHIEAYCLKCHGDPASAPATIRERYQGGFGYKLGDLRGVLGIRLPAAASESRVTATLFREQAYYLTGFLLALLVGGLLIKRLVIRRLGEFQSGADQLARGRYETRLAVDGPDETASLAKAFNSMAAAIQQREESLRISQSRFQSLFSGMSEGCALHRLIRDAAGKPVDYEVLEVNDSFERETGQEAASVKGRTGREIHGGDSPPLLQEYAYVVDTGVSIRMERHVQALNRYFDISVSPWGEDGFATLLTDITDRRHAEQALSESETMFHTMVDWTYDWEYWVDPDGSFHYITPSAERVTGFQAEDFRRTPALIDAIVHAEDRHVWERHTHHHLGTGSTEGVAELDFRIVRKQGDIRWVTHTCRPVCDQSGRYLGRRVTVRDITARKEAEEQIRHLAYYDSLTGLPNRRLFMDRLGQAIISSNRAQEHGALLLLDLDHFKTLNDTQGHETGDHLLREVARRLRACVRQEDTVARLGGDEFLVLIEALGVDEAAAAAQAETVAEKIRGILIEPYSLPGLTRGHHSTPSIGLTLFHGLTCSAELLLKQVEVALYQAKDSGRDTVRFFNPAMQSAIDARTTLETALRQALLQEEFRLFYQPQINLDGELIGAEALVRWLPPGQDPVPPGNFIPLAEDTGLIVPLGQWVLDTACDQIKAWSAQPSTRHMTLAINVSARQFHQADFVARVRDSLARSGADPSRLKLELTESVVLSNVDEVILRMAQLRDLGVGFSLDDFGTGYSSLAYLKRLPLDQLKIDQSFVRDITRDANDAAIVRAILAMSQTLGLDVIAEGVETPEQRDFLRENGCVAYQGYLFGRPMPIEDWAALV